MEFKFWLGLSVITLILIVPIIYFGRKLSKKVQKQAPESDLAMTITPTGFALMICMIGFLVVSLFVKDLMPESNFGQFLNTTDGSITMFISSVLFFIVAGWLFEKISSPIAKKGGSKSYHLPFGRDNNYCEKNHLIHGHKQVVPKV